jgi:hypothetical protein
VKADTSAESIRSAIMGMSEDAVLAERVKEAQRLVQRDAGAEETVNRLAEYIEATHG